jgi:hypothetical protein
MRDSVAEEEFYADLGEMLGTGHDYVVTPGRWKKRWGPRTPGNGRFSGHGIVRCFGETVHVALYKPHIHGIYGSKDEALRMVQGALVRDWLNGE